MEYQNITFVCRLIKCKLTLATKMVSKEDIAKNGYNYNVSFVGSIFHYIEQHLRNKRKIL